MTTFTPPDLRRLRDAYSAPDFDARRARLRAAGLSPERLAVRLEKVAAEAAAHAAAMSAFDAALEAAERGQGGADPAALWNGALALIPQDPETYRIAVPTAAGLVYVRL